MNRQTEFNVKIEQQGTIEKTGSTNVIQSCLYVVVLLLALNFLYQYFHDQNEEYVREDDDQEEEAEIP